METQPSTSTKRIKFPRLCLSQGRVTQDGHRVQSSQISKFFTRSSPGGNNQPISATQSISDRVKSTTEEPASSRESEQSTIEEKSFASRRATAANEPKVAQKSSQAERVASKRLLDATDTTADSKSTIKNFFATENDESLGDFEVPKKIARKPPKATTTKKAKVTKSRSKKQPDIRKILQKQTDGIGLDEDEQMQLAVELSKAESVDRIDLTNFEYKPRHGTKEPASIFGVQKTAKGGKKWKSKCTPLTRRDDKILDQRRRERIDDLLTDNILIESLKLRESSQAMDTDAHFVFDVSSKVLQRICVAEKILLEINDSAVRSDRCIQQYYTNNLVEQSTVAVGSLLRNWNDIPGRDSVFDGFPPPPQAITVDKHDREMPEIEQDECNELVILDQNVEFVDESRNVESVREIATTSDDTDETIIVDTNAIEAELNVINSRVRLDQDFAASTVCGSKTIALELHRGPSPDLFDDDDYDYDANYRESDSFTCSRRPSDPGNDVVLVLDSPPVDANEIQTTKEVVVNETLADKSPLIVISDESNSNHSIDRISQGQETEKHEEKALAIIDTASTSLTKTLSFTERLELMDRDVSEDFATNVPASVFDNVERNESQTTQCLSQESVALSDDEINYSMNFGNRSLIDMAVTSPTANQSEQRNFNGDEIDDYDMNFDFGCNVNDFDLINQSICEMFEKTFEYRDPGKSNENRDKQATPKSSSKVWKKTHSERLLVSKHSHLSISDNNHCAATAVSSNATKTTSDLSTDDYIIRYDAMSPMPDYDRMEITDLQQELKRFGLKQSLKKRQAIICLEYIYNRTHPYIEGENDDTVVKTHHKSTANAPNEPNEVKLNFNVGFSHDHLVDEKFKSLQIDRFFLPSWPRAKRPWCLQPLHIAWHNLAKANRELSHMVLEYTPIELRDLKNYFKTIDMMFDNKDLIAFLDIHCITFRTSKTNNNSS